MASKEKITAFILAGGRSQRFSADKALQDWHGVPLLAHVASLVRPFVSDVLVVSHQTSDYAGVVNAPAIADIHPDCGPLGGIHAGLSHTNTAWNLFVACDMPQLKPEVLSLLVDQIDAQALAVVPQLDERLVPTLALYHRNALALAELMLQQGNFRLQHFCRSLPCKVVSSAQLRQVDPHLQSLTNLNTLKDWEQAKAQSDPTRT